LPNLKNTSNLKMYFFKQLDQYTLWFLKMKRAEFFERLKSWKRADIIHLVIALLFNPNVDKGKIISFIESTFQDYEINKALKDIGREERLV